MIELRVLGSPTLIAPDGDEGLSVLAQPRRLALLTYLAMHTADGFHRRDRLLGLFWPEMDEKSARSALTAALSYIKKALGEGVVTTRGKEEVGISSTEVWCDASAFIHEVRHGDPAFAGELYRGDLLEGLIIDVGLDFDRWLEGERARLRRAAVDVMGVVVESGVPARGLDVGVWAERAVALDPMDGPSVRRLMEILSASGHRSAVLDVYARFAQRLEEDWGIEPPAEMADFVSRIREGTSGAIPTTLGVPRAHGPTERKPRLPKRQASVSNVGRPGIGGGISHGAGTLEDWPGHRPDGRLSTRGWAVRIAIATVSVATVLLVAGRGPAPTQQWWYWETPPPESGIDLLANETPAQQAYWKGADALHRWASGGRMTLEESRDHYSTAVAMDPDLGVAWLFLAEANAMLFSRHGRRAEDAAASLAAVEALRRRAPGSAEALAAGGLYARRVERAPLEARRRMEEANDALPNNASILQWLAYIERDLGNVDRSIDLLYQVQDVLPGMAARQLALVLMMSRRFDEAEDILARRIDARPNDTAARANLSEIALSRDGDLDARRTFLERYLPARGISQLSWWRLEFMAGQYAEALAILAEAPNDATDPEPAALLRARTLRALGDSAAAKRAFEESRADLERSSVERSTDERYRLSLAEVYASLGMTRDAALAMNAAEALVPEDHASRGNRIRFAWAVVHTWLGEFDLATAQLERLLDLPSGYTQHDFALNPLFQPLHNNARFRRLADLR
jgi:DNA-binding SARP family transcriptional activator